MPPEELEVFRKLEQEGNRTIGEVTDSVFHATSTSANGIYVVEVLDADRINPEHEGDTVTVVPTGGSDQFEVETDLLRPFLKGEDIDRWNADWSGLHLIHPTQSRKTTMGMSSARAFALRTISKRIYP